VDWGAGTTQSEGSPGGHLVELIGKTVALKRRGKNYIGLARSFGKDASFNVDPVKQYFKCSDARRPQRDRLRDEARSIELYRRAPAIGWEYNIELPNSGGNRQNSSERKSLRSALGGCSSLKNYSPIRSKALRRATI